MGRRAITRLSLPEAIATDLRERILSGEMVEGETIRQEALAEEYDVSRMPIREALKRLDAEGLIQLTTNRGARVIKHSLEEIGEIFDLRALIEVDLFARSIPEMTKADFELCETLLDEMDTSYDANDVEKWGALNYQFHAALYGAARRNLTNDVLQRINLLSDRYVRMNLSVMEQRETAKEEHHKMLRFAQEGAVEAACAVLVDHIGRTKSQLLELVSARRDAADK